MTYSIVLFGEPVLEKQAAAVTEFNTPELHQLIDDMFESMYAAKGVGLAAPQIGIAKRIAVIALRNAADARMKASSTMRPIHCTRCRISIGDLLDMLMKVLRADARTTSLDSQRR